MSRNTLIAGLVCLAYPMLSAAASDAVNTGDVVVTAARIPQKVDETLADVTVIDREQIEKSGQSTLAELLQSQPGIEIASNGGDGKSVSLFLRGSTAQQVMVLIDGMHMESATLGTTSLQDIPLEQIERIEIVRGAASSFYGSEAIGGVVQIFTRRGDDKTRINATVGYGGFNTRQMAAGISGAISDDLHYAFNVSDHKSDGISALRVSSGVDADNDGYHNQTVSGSLNYQLMQGHEVGVQLYQSSNRNDFDDSNFPAIENAVQRSIAITSRDQIMSYWLSNLRIGKSTDDDDTHDNNGFGHFRTDQDQLSWQNDFQLPLGTLTLAYDRVEDHVDGNPGNLNFTVTSRTNNGLLASYFVNSGAQSLQASIRHDDNSQFGDHVTGNIGYGYRITSAWRVTGSFGTAFRAPTFDDLYWPLQNFGGGFTYQGNPNLKPETSRNKEVGLAYDADGQRVSANVYHNDVKNLIVASQGLANDSAANVGSATLEGVTLAYQGEVMGVTIRSSADFQDPTDNTTGLWLARRAHKHGSLWLGHGFGALELGGEIIASGKRFDDAANTRELGGYSLLNLTADYKLSPQWSLNARANNVLDKQYTLATQFGTPFNTPGANLFVSLRWQSQ